MGKHSQLASRNSHLVIRDFQADDQPAARELILEGLREHWGEDFAPGRNPDLDDIAASYGEGVCLVALLGDSLVGTGMLIPERGGAVKGGGVPAGERVARILRMSVASVLRRQGIGSRLLESLCTRARENGYRKIVLETTSTWEDAKAFYREAGFKVLGERDGDTHFEREL